jgi:hypothetical protein
MKFKPNQKIHLDASKLVGFSEVDKFEQKIDAKLQPKVGKKPNKIISKVGTKVGKKPNRVIS